MVAQQKEDVKALPQHKVAQLFQSASFFHGKTTSVVKACPFLGQNIPRGKLFHCREAGPFWTGRNICAMLTWTGL